MYAKTKHPIPLICLRGMIASLAVENPSHREQLEKIDILRGRFGDLACVDSDEIIEILYHDKERMHEMS